VFRRGGGGLRNGVSLLGRFCKADAVGGNRGGADKVAGERRDGFGSDVVLRIAQKEKVSYVKVEGFKIGSMITG